MKFDGKTVLVTGGALGIGRGACEIFAERGAAVAIVDLDDKAGRELCVEIEKAGGKAVFYHADVANMNHVNVAVESTLEKFGSIDSLVVKASFPPLMLAPINFEAVYMQAKRNQSERAAVPPS